MKRSSGILLHISSLPSEYGIGALGKEAYKFVDFLSSTNQKYWQILPIGPTLYGDSPYQSPSAYAGNPYFIDLESLCEDGIIQKSDIDSLHFGSDPLRVDYGALYIERPKLYDKICEGFGDGNDEYKMFCESNAHWLDDYALFMALKNENRGRPWNTLPSELKQRNKEALTEKSEQLRDEIKKQKILQYIFFDQWQHLKKYANDRGVKIIGDMPIYVAYDSADVWSSPTLFKLDSSLQPTVVAGCPPDGFSPLGQRWGNPIYNWDESKKELFSWWKSRISHSLCIYDVIRIDHFRGFSDYYEIPAPEHTAVNGHWEKGPGLELFNYLKKELGELPIIAEDLGFLNEDVRKMLEGSGFPGMKVLQFAFDSFDDNGYLPHNYTRNCVIYTGTHDNDTVLGWINNAGDEKISRVKKYFGLPHNASYDEIADAFIRAAYSGVGDTAVIPIQDLLKQGNESRMNLPSSVEGNWIYRMPKDYFEKIDRERIREYTMLYAR